jgi:glutathione S-transferase
MALNFYYGSGSPYSWRVWLALEHKGIAYEARRLYFDRGDTAAEAFRAVNPRGKVPAVVPDGRPLRESGVILEYLEEVWPTPSLLPGDLGARAQARLIAREADEQLDRPLQRLLRETLFRPRDGGSPEKIASARADLAQELARLEETLADGAWLAGDLSLADFTVYPQLRMARRLGERMPQHAVDDLIGPGLAAWMGRVESLPYYPRTVPPHWKE